MGWDKASKYILRSCLGSDQASFQWKSGVKIKPNPFLLPVHCFGICWFTWRHLNTHKYKSRVNKEVCISRIQFGTCIAGEAQISANLHLLLSSYVNQIERTNQYCCFYTFCWKFFCAFISVGFFFSCRTQSRASVVVPVERQVASQPFHTLRPSLEVAFSAARVIWFGVTLNGEEAVGRAAVWDWPRRVDN